MKSVNSKGKKIAIIIAFTVLLLVMNTNPLPTTFLWAASML